jgi:hypothetical protein
MQSRQHRQSLPSHRTRWSRNSHYLRCRMLLRLTQTMQLLGNGSALGRRSGPRPHVDSFVHPLCGLELLFMRIKSCVCPLPGTSRAPPRFSIEVNLQISQGHAGEDVFGLRGNGITGAFQRTGAWCAVQRVAGRKLCGRLGRLLHDVGSPRERAFSA